jgi:SAM-dependent methyltransferase
MPQDEQDAAEARAARVRQRLTRLRRKRLRQYRDMLVTGYVRNCPVCGYEGEFAPYGVPPRLDAYCPSCSSLERHRLLKLWLDRNQRITKEHRILHFAPEPAFVPLLRAMAGEYQTADLMRSSVDLKLNIEELDLPDGRFDVIIAHQILEHVDHHVALRECFRCLAPGGLLIVTTPVIEAWAQTYVNPEATSKRDRVLYFGQGDHTRFFGRDLRDHMAAAGFRVEEFVSAEPDVSKYALWRGETLFLLERPAAVAAKPATRSTARAPSGATVKRATGTVAKPRTVAAAKTKPVTPRKKG